MPKRRDSASSLAGECSAAATADATNLDTEVTQGIQEGAIGGTTGGAGSFALRCQNSHRHLARREKCRLYNQLPMKNS